MAAGIGSEAVLLLPSHLGKWGIQSGTVSLPAVAAIGTLSLDVVLACYVRKVVWCKGRTNTSEALECNVKKEARLESVTQIQSSGDAADLTTLCISAGGTRSGSTCGGTPVPRCCQNPAPGHLTLFANISTPNDACSAVVKIL